MYQIERYSEFAIVGAIRHFTNGIDGCSIGHKELVAKLTKLFGDKTEAENALKKATSQKFVVANNNEYSLSAHIKEIIDNLSESWERTILPRIE